MFTHFYSDPHFGHYNILGFCDRPWETSDEMAHGLIQNYNRGVTPVDYVLWVGDCTFHEKKFLKEVLPQLNGRKALIRGNHDPSARRCVMRYGFQFVTDRLWIDLDGLPGLVCHYPPLGAKDTKRDNDTRYWDRRPEFEHGVVYIHGHTHEDKKTFGKEKRIHVGVDAWDYAPAPWGEVVEIAHKLIKPRKASPNV